MNTPKELIDHYTHLYDVMKGSRDVSKMKMFGTAFTSMFKQVANVHPDIAKATLEYLGALEYNNYLTMNEAQEIASIFINDDTSITGVAEPTKGAHWSMEALKSFLTSKGMPLEEKPYYNWHALWVTTNMIYSDFANSFVELMGAKDNSTIATASYKLAIKKLKDLDRPSFIREYFEMDK